MTCSDSKDFLSYIVSRKTLHIIELNKHAYSYSIVMWGYLYTPWNTTEFGCTVHSVTLVTEHARNSPLPWKPLSSLKKLVGIF